MHHVNTRVHVWRTVVAYIRSTVFPSAFLHSMDVSGQFTHPSCHIPWRGQRFRGKWTSAPKLRKLPMYGSGAPGAAPFMMSERAMAKMKGRKSAPHTYNLDMNLIGDYWGWWNKRSYHHTGKECTLRSLHIISYYIIAQHTA